MCIFYIYTFIFAVEDHAEDIIIKMQQPGTTERQYRGMQCQGEPFKRRLACTDECTQR